MYEKKTKAIEVLDEALDGEIIYYAERFAEEPNVRDLEMLCDLVTVDMYTDKYLEKAERTAMSPPANMR